MELANKSDDEILKIANPIMDNLMEGSKEIDHEKHTRDFTDRMKGIVTKDYLKKVCERYQAEWGHFAKREFVAVFRRPSSAAIICPPNKRENSWPNWSLLREIRDIWLTMQWCFEPALTNQSTGRSNAMLLASCYFRR